jgi:hypothetical protein
MAARDAVSGRWKRMEAWMRPPYSLAVLVFQHAPRPLRAKRATGGRDVRAARQWRPHGGRADRRIREQRKILHSVANFQGTTRMPKDRVADDLGREPMMIVRIGRWHHVPVSPASLAAAKPGYRDDTVWGHLALSLSSAPTPLCMLSISPVIRPAILAGTRADRTILPASDSCPSGALWLKLSGSWCELAAVCEEMVDGRRTKGHLSVRSV